MNMKALKATEQVEKLLSDNYIGGEVEPYDMIPAFTVHISWGDWKHDHLRAKYLIENANLGTFIKSETTEEDGSDCYSATHYFILPEYACVRKLFEE